MAKESNITTVSSATAFLNAGGVIVYPTDTVYGLGADATNAHAVEKVRIIKGRDAGKPILAMVADVSMLEAWALMTPLARELATRFLPGPLTLVLMPRTDALLSVASPEDGSVGFRIPEHDLCRALARELGRPITSTSVNRSGEPQAADVSHMLAQLGRAATGHISLVIDIGPLQSSMPSTIVDARGTRAIIRREGAVSRELLADFL